jgi:hypothetical protein
MLTGLCWRLGRRHLLVSTPCDEEFHRADVFAYGGRPGLLHVCAALRATGAATDPIDTRDNYW